MPLVRIALKWMPASARPRACMWVAKLTPRAVCNTSCAYTPRVGASRWLWARGHPRSGGTTTCSDAAHAGTIAATLPGRPRLCPQLLCCNPASPPGAIAPRIWPARPDHPALPSALLAHQNHTAAPHTNLIVKYTPAEGRDTVREALRSREACAGGCGSSEPPVPACRRHNAARRAAHRNTSIYTHSPAS